MITKKKPMTREEIFASITELNVETQVRAWKMQVDDRWYHICSYGGIYGILVQCSIWESNSSGKRNTEEPIWSLPGRDHLASISGFLDTLNY